MLTNILFITLPLVVTYLLSTIWHRRRKQYADFPQLKSSLLWGHGQAMHEWMQRGAPKLHIDHILMAMAKELGNPSVMLLDFRPFTYPLVCINSHEVAEQISRASKSFPWSVPKSPTIHSLVRVIGKQSILTRQGDDWKQLRKRFNPGFAPQHLMTLLPCILDKTSTFIENLDRYASTGEEFPLNKVIIDLTFDIIGAITMGVDFDAQHSESSRQSRFIRLYEELLSLYGVDDDRLPWWMYPKREWRRYRLSVEIDSYVEDMIREKHAEQREGRGGVGARSVLSLSLKGGDELTDDIVHETRDQIKSFLFAGHDTTSILLAWLFYELSRTPKVLQAVRDELDEVFGPDLDPAVLREKLLAPNGGDLIHRLPYITAVIKEVLRLYPPAGSARMTAPGTGFTVRTPEGQNLCLDGMIIYNCATLIQRDRTVFGDSADDFVPERWLGDKSGIMSADAQVEKDPASGAGGAKFPAGAWRPFERGPRNCIGQDLATIEARVIIAAVARRYDFVKVGLGELDCDEKGQPVLVEKGQFRTKSELYNTAQVTAKPIDAMMMRVKRR